MEAVGNDPLVKEALIGTPFELIACCLGPSWPGYPWITSAVTARIQRSSFIVIAVKATLQQNRACANETRSERCQGKTKVRTKQIESEGNREAKKRDHGQKIYIYIAVGHSEYPEDYCMQRMKQVNLGENTRLTIQLQPHLETFTDTDVWNSASSELSKASMVLMRSKGLVRTKPLLKLSIDGSIVPGSLVLQPYSMVLLVRW